MICLNPITAYENPEKGRPIFGWAGFSQGLRELQLPCGKCASCIHNYYSYWATRGFYELLNWKQNWFVTFTYNDKHLPKNRSLSKKEFQKFVKKLKKQFGSSKKNPVRQIYCGEYGEKTKRPHYHAIFFNLNLHDPSIDPDNVLVEKRLSDQGHLCYTNKFLSNLWRKGDVEVSEATPATIAYLFKYVLKKKTRKEKMKPLSIEHNGLTYDVAHEFIEASRNPGIGAHLRHSRSIRKGYLSVDGKIKALPKYFLEYLKNTDPRFYEELKNQRTDYAATRPKISRDEQSRINAVLKENQKLKKRD